MKTFLKKSIYLFILLGLTVSLNGCSDDDEVETKTIYFLEKYDQTKWFTLTEGFPEDNDLYMQLNNTILTSLEGWSTSDGVGTCYEYSATPIVFDLELGGKDVFKITENSEDKLSFEIIFEEGDSQTLTLSVTNNVLLYELSFTEDGSTININFLLNPTEVDFTEFDICPDGI